MKNYNHFKKSWKIIDSKFSLCFILTILIFSGTVVDARPFSHKNIGFGVGEKCVTDPEKKVDYLERIYFSGQNKAGLVTMINSSIQEMESKPATQAVARQYVFLTGIKDQAAAAETSCQVEEILAAGIYDIDAVEAAAQNVTQPKQHINLDSILASVNNVNDHVGNTAAAVYTLSNGTAAGGALSATSKISEVTNTVSEVNETVKDVKQLIHFFSKDKPCKHVIPKIIEIGDHSVTNTSAAVDN